MREMALAGALALAGCASTPTAPVVQGGSGAGLPGVTAPSAAEFVAAQAQRVAHLSDFASRGSAELRWADAKGSHFEQAQVELAWRERGQRMALRADKLGERLAWAGADATQWWIFEPKAEPSSLVRGPRGVVPQDVALPFAGPESVMELLAARAWPQSAVAEACADGSTSVRWMVTPSVDQWVATRAVVPRPGALPTRVELLKADGSVLASSELSRPMLVRVDTLPTGAWPEVAGTVRLRMAGEGGATWDVFWDAPAADPERLKDRLFDLTVLRSVMRPQREIDLGASGGAKGSER